jgi:hypothetical protein
MVFSFELANSFLELMNVLVKALSKVLNFELVVGLKFDKYLGITWFRLIFLKLERLVEFLKLCVVTLPLQELGMISRHLSFKTFLKATEFRGENRFPVNLGLLFGWLHMLSCGVGGRRHGIVVVVGVEARIPIVGSRVFCRRQILISI